MNIQYFQQIISKILCDLQDLKEATVKKISILLNGNLKTEDVKSINFTGNVNVTSDSLGNTEVNILGNGGGSTDCEECLEFDGDRPITRNVLGLLGQNLGTQGVIDTLEELLYPYLPPSITLSVTQTIREKDNIDVAMTATIVTSKGSNNITEVSLTRDTTEIYDEVSVNPNGQTINTGENIQATDNTTTTPYLVQYIATVSDGVTSVNSSVRNVTFVYPFYRGTGAAALNETNIKSVLSTVVTTPGNKVYTFSPNNEKIYFCYPASYGLLTSITDGALPLLGAFTLRTDTFTMLDNQVVTYNIYESNNLLTETGYTLYFNF